MKIVDHVHWPMVSMGGCRMMVQLVKLVNLKLVVPIRCSSHLKIHDDTFIIKSMHGLASVQKYSKSLTVH